MSTTQKTLSVIFVFILSLTALVVSCSKKKKNDIPVWSFTNYSLCSPQLHSSWSSLPYDIAFTTYRTNLRYRYDNFNSMRPYLLYGSTKTIKDIGSGLIEYLGQTRVNFEFWSEDGNTAYIWRLFEDPQNAMYEEFTKSFRFGEEYYLADLIAYDVNSDTFFNFTGTERISYFNQSIFYWPSNPTKIGFHSLIDEKIRPYIADRTGQNKSSPVSIPGVAYTTTASNDGTRYTFHADYNIFLGNITNNTETAISQNCAFEFFPIWAPDSSKFAFVCGTSSTNNNIFLADRDGTVFKLLASRNGYSGVVGLTDTFDHHGGGSDYYDWTPDSQYLIYAARSNITNAIEIFRVDSNTDVSTQLTTSPANTHNYYPQVSPDGNTLVFVSNRNGIRNIYTLELQTPGFPVTQITDLASGCGVFEPYWRP